MSGIREAEKERVGDSQDFYQGAKWEKKGDLICHYAQYRYNHKRLKGGSQQKGAGVGNARYGTQEVWTPCPLMKQSNML